MYTKHYKTTTGGNKMKFLKSILCFMLCFGLVIGTTSVSMAATGTATSSGLSARIQKLPGEPTYYDPDTGVYFNPYNGVIQNFSTQYTKLPGENKYYKTGANKMYFVPSIYSQFVTSSSVKLTAYKSTESTSGFTIYLGPTVDLGGGIGGSISGGLALSYNKSTKKWTQSIWGSGGVSTVVGVDNQAGIIIGFSNGNETTISGLSVGGSGNIPIGDISVYASGKTVNVSLKISLGPAAGGSGGTSYTVSKQLFTVNPFF